jgi:hypothetical protein
VDALSYLQMGQRWMKVGQCKGRPAAIYKYSVSANQKLAGINPILPGDGKFPRL